MVFYKIKKNFIINLLLNRYITNKDTFSIDVVHIFLYKLIDYLIWNNPKKFILNNLLFE